MSVIPTGMNSAALALIVDRSGSMHSIASDVKGSVKQFIGDQKKQEGSANLTVVQFDDRYDVVYDYKDIKEVDEDKFVKEYAPRGSTALLDAIGRTVLEMKAKLDAMTVENRPQRVVVAVITDGHENASTEFTVEKIKALISENEKLGWDFMFMGATLDTIDVAQNLGFSKGKSAYFESCNVGSLFSMFSQQVTQARLNKEVDITEEERAKLACVSEK